MNISFTVCVCVCVYTVTDLSAEDKASGIKFCTVVYRRPGQGISPFWGTLIPQKPKIRRVGQPPGSKLYSVKAYRKSKVYGVKAARPTINVTLEMRCSWNIARRVDVGSACVDIRPSRKTVFQQKSILIKNLLKR